MCVNMVTQGVSSTIIAEPGMKHGMNVYVLSGGRKIAQFKHDKKGKRACLCYTVDGDHAWFYESETVRRSISHLNMRDASMTKAIAQDFQSTRAEYRTWKEWYNNVTEPGYYDTDDLTTARLVYLANNFFPKVTFQNGEVTALHIPLYRQHVYKKTCLCKLPVTLV